MARSYEDEMTIDPATGLPHLPEGRAWNVTGDPNYIMVQIMVLVENPPTFWEKLTGARSSEWEPARAIDSWKSMHVEPSKEAIAVCAREIYQSIHARYKGKAAAEELFGMYPPKSIL